MPGEQGSHWEHPALRAVPEPSNRGEEGTAALPWPLETPDGEGMKGGGWSEKAFDFRWRLGQLLHRGSLPRGRQIWLYLPQPQLLLSPQPWCWFSSQHRSCGRRRRCWFTASEQKSPMEQKPSMAESPVPAQRSPYLPDLQKIPELYSWDLSGGRSAGILWDSA